MKKKLFFALGAVVLLTSVLSAQDTDMTSLYNKGRWILGTQLGGSFSIVSVKDSEDNLTQLNIELDGGYFVMDNLAVGLVSGFTHTKLGDTDNSNFHIGPFARYYTNMNLFFGAGYLYSSTKDSEDFGTIPVEIGYAYFFNRYLALEPAITIGIPGNNSNNFITNFGIGLGLYLN